jgi:hypothetical protein
MHALFFLKHSRAGDDEIRFALRGIARNCPFIEKVWIFGDRPYFISEDTRLIEHVLHSYVAGVGRFQTPVTNHFLATWLSSLIPELSPEYLLFSDDQIVLAPLSYEDAKQDRYLQDLAELKTRARGMFRDTLWRTYDLLKRMGYTGYNFETHCPTYYTKRRVLEAYLEFKDFVTEDRWQGILGPTAILNHAYAKDRFPLLKLGDEGRYAGFHDGTVTYCEIVSRCQGKTFLNFDDVAFDENMRRFLREMLPEPSPFEKHGTTGSQTGPWGSFSFSV